MDLKVPDGDGLAVARHIRANSDVGIIIITGKGHESDRILGLEFGADDYVTKPFSSRELVARIKAVLRRTRTTTFGDTRSTDGPVLTFSDWTFDPGSRGLFSPGGDEVSLTTAEFSLLNALVQTSRRALSRDQLLTAVHGDDWYGYDRGVDGLVSRLRRKFVRAHPSATGFIKSIRGYG